MKNQYSNQSKQHTDDELANNSSQTCGYCENTDGERQIFAVQVPCHQLPERWLPIDAPVFGGCRSGIPDRAVSEY